MKQNKLHIPVSMLFLFCCFAVLLFGFDQSAAGHAEQNKEYVSDMVRKAAISCYGVEGFYPEDLTYLREHYDVKIDDDLYQVHYEWVADNIPPDIQIFVKGEK